MATHNIVCAPVKISVIASVSLRFTPHAQPLDDVLAKIYPVRSQVVQLDPYRVKSGWPQQVPLVDVRSHSMISCAGISLANRPEPGDITTNADVRWCCQPGTYDEITHVWRPISGIYSHYRWLSSEDFAPTYMEDFQYIIGKELFRRQVLNFDASTSEHMWSDFPGGLTNTTGYTVIMVVWLNSALGNTNGRLFSGLWAPGEEVPMSFDQLDPSTWQWDESSQTGYSLMLQRDVGLVVDTESRVGTQGLNVDQLISSARPAYIAVTFARPYSTIWASMGPGKTREFTIFTGTDVVPQEFNIVLGRSNGSLFSAADMALFDIGIYGDLLTSEQIESEISVLSQVYGS